MQAGKLVVVGDEPQPAVEALILVGVTGVEKNPFVPDDILQEFAVGERGPADIVGGESCQVGPVPREPFGMVCEPAPVALDMDQRGLLPESAYRREDRHSRGGIVEVGGQVGHVGIDRVLLVRIDDVASAEFQQDFTPDITVRVFDRGRIGETDRLAVVADADVVPAVSREAVGGGTEGGRHDVADVGRDAALEAFAEEPDLVPAGVACKGVETVVEGLVVKGDPRLQKTGR